jgi:hypothetical protein
MQSYSEKKLFELEILRPDDTEEEIKTSLPYFMIYFLTFKIFRETFDFSDEVFFENIALLGDRPK